MMFVLLISCSKNKTFKIVNLKDVDSNTVIGYGFGKAVSPKLAKIKAKSNASLNLINQVMGMDYKFEKSNGTILFKTNSKGVLNNVQEVATYQLSNNKCLVVLSADKINHDLDSKSSICLMKGFQTNDFESAMIDQFKIAINEYNPPQKNEVNGKIYINDLQLSYSENLEVFDVNLTITLINSGK